MRTLATTLKTLRNSLTAHAPQSPGGFDVWCPAPIRLRARQTPTDDVPIGVDANRQPVSIPRDEHVLVVGDPRTLVTTALRTIALHHARFPATRVHVYEPAPLGDLTVLRALAHRYISYDDDAVVDVTAMTEDLEKLAAEIDRRHRVLTKLNADIAAAGLDVEPVRSIPELHRLLPTAWTSTLLKADIDIELTGLARHVVVIGDAMRGRWVLSDDEGQAFTAALTRVAIRGADVGVSLVIGVKSPYLSYLPPALIKAIGTRIALRLRDPQHTDTVLGLAARRMGVDTSETLPGQPGRMHGYGMCWVSGAVHRGVYEQAQLYATSPDRFKVEAIRQARVRRRDNRLTGDAADRYGR